MKHLTLQCGASRGIHPVMDPVGSMDILTVTELLETLESLLFLSIEYLEM